MGIEDFERYPLMFGPSPVHRLDRLSAHLGGPSIWAKRDECSPTTLGRWLPSPPDWG